MAESLLRDQQRVSIAGGQSNADATVVLPFKIDSVTGRLLVTTSGAAGISLLVATGTVDDSNTVFTFASTPAVVNVNGMTYVDGHGVSISGTTATLDSAPGTGGWVYGIA